MFSKTPEFDINFTNDIAPLMAAIEVVLKIFLFPELASLKVKYTDNFLKTEVGRDRYKELIKKYSNYTYNDFLNQNYRNKILDYYFTEEGILSLIFYELLHRTETIE